MIFFFEYYLLLWETSLVSFSRARMISWTMGKISTSTSLASNFEFGASFRPSLSPPALREMAFEGPSIFEGIWCGLFWIIYGVRLQPFKKSSTWLQTSFFMKTTTTESRRKGLLLFAALRAMVLAFLKTTKYCRKAPYRHIIIALII